MKLSIIDHGHEKQAALLQKTISKRIPVEIEKTGLLLELKIDSTLGASESYRIEAVDYGYCITGSDDLGLYYGIGKLLHTARWTETDFVPCPPVGLQSPECSFRASYFSIHFYNWYHTATKEALSDYLDELLLWGYNAIHCTLPKINVDSVEEAAFLDAVEKVRTVFSICRSYGMQISLSIGSNQGLRSAPDEILADYSCYDTRNGGNLGKNICPAKPAGLAYLKNLWEHTFQTFADLSLDYMIVWPYDEGGCGCEQCRPWGSVGFPNMIPKAYEIAKKYHPNIKVIASTWFFDDPVSLGEFEGFYPRLQTDLKDVVDYLMIDAPGDYPKYPLTHEVIKPIVNFPEISMYGVFPWGGRGAVPLLRRFEKIWNTSKKILDGGMPYSEGLYEDISKVQFAGYYWEKDRSYQDIMAEYINYEFPQADANEVIELMERIEENHTGVAAGLDPDPKAWERAYALALSIDHKLSQKRKSAWRWRMLYIRTVIDKKVYDYYNEKGRYEENGLTKLAKTDRAWLAEDAEAQALLQELCKIDCCVSDNGENHWTLPPVKDGIVKR